jgi:hypothetical protein
MGVKVNVRSRGLGDTIAKITRVTGIEKAVNTVVKATTGNDECGKCKQRQEMLNKAFPYKNQ